MISIGLHREGEEMPAAGASGCLPWACCKWNRVFSVSIVCKTSLFRIQEELMSSKMCNQIPCPQLGRTPEFTGGLKVQRPKDHKALEEGSGRREMLVRK